MLYWTASRWLKTQAHLNQAAPNITRYYKVDGSEPALFLMEVGTLVKPGTQPASSEGKDSGPVSLCRVAPVGQPGPHRTRLRGAAEGHPGGQVGAHRRKPGVDLLLREC